MGKLGNEGIKSAVFIFLGFGVATISNLFLLPHWFSKAELGQIQIMINWALVLSQFLSFGSASIAVRFYPAFNLKGEAGKVLFMCFMLPLLGMVLFGLYLVLFGDTMLSSLSDHLLISPTDALVTLFGMTIFQSYLKSYGGLAISRRRVWINFMLNEFYVRLVMIVGYYLYFVKVITYTELFYFITLSFLSQIVILILAQEKVVFSRKDIPGKKQFKELFTFGSYSLMDSGVTTLINRLDIIMIGFLLVNANVHAQEYVMAANIVTMLMLPWRSVTAAASPFVSEAFAKGDMEKIGNLYQKVSLNATLLGGLIFVIILAGIPEIFSIIPDNYYASIVPLVILGFSKLTDMVTSINNMIIMFSKHYQWNLVFSAIVVVGAILFNIIFIPWYNTIVGAALAALLATLAYNALKCMFVYRKFGLHPFHKKLPNALILLTGLFFMGYYFPVVTQNHLLNLTIKSAAIGLVFFAGIVSFRISEDLRKTGRKYLSWVGIRLRD